MNDGRGLDRTALSGLVVVVCGLLVAGCSAADGPKPGAGGRSPSAVVAVTVSGSVGTEMSDAGATVPCSDDLGVTTPIDDQYRLVLDAVALPARTLVPQGSGEPGWLFAKQGLVVRAGTAVDIMVAPGAVGHVRIGWGSPGPEATAIHVPACPSGSGWLAFAGGYTVRTPTCVPLLVRTHGQQERVEVGVGAHC